MNKKLYLIFTLILTLGTNVSSAEALVKLLVSPCDYNEKDVYTSGYLGFISPSEPHRARLFLSNDDFKFNNLEQSIIVNVPNEIAIKKEIYNKKYVSVSGKFNCSVVSHGSVYPGGFTEVSRLYLAFKNPHFSPNTFINGKLQEIQVKQLDKFGNDVIKIISQKQPILEKVNLLFGEDSKKISIDRFSWIFESYLAEKDINLYQLCKVYKSDFLQYNDMNERFFCYSKSTCKLPEYKNAENLPLWSSESDHFCLEFEVENNIPKLSWVDFL